ncbi:FXSXX-COOH protein [Streptomyces venezuelae]|uniref:FXSXX-COOH protein n=1 Tax=Streptomyces venezuelae TaxID=54571 RepID=UPI0012397A93|nr:FXSXX-COOH protein [Streptomyces venezuelae]
MNTSASPAPSSVKAHRVPLSKIDVHTASMATTLGRVLPAESSRPVQAPIFNSAL